MNITAEKAKALRHTKAALSTINYENIYEELYEITEACGEVHYIDEDTLTASFDGDTEDENDFRLCFAEVENSAERLLNQLNYTDGIGDYFDDCLVSLIGNRYQTVGYDDYEEDYFSLCGVEREWAEDSSKNRLMRHTKKEIINMVGQCVGIAIAFVDVRLRYAQLKATLDILLGENRTVLQIIKDIENAYIEANADEFYSGYESVKRFDALVSRLPEKMWVE